MQHLLKKTSITSYMNPVAPFTLLESIIQIHRLILKVKYRKTLGYISSEHTTTSIHTIKCGQNKTSRFFKCEIRGKIPVASRTTSTSSRTINILNLNEKALTLMRSFNIHLILQSLHVSDTHTVFFFFFELVCNLHGGSILACMYGQ